MLLSVAFPAASGAATWSMSFPSLSSFATSAMATEVFPDGSLAALGGDEEGRVAVVRLDPQGTVLWEKRLGIDGPTHEGRIAPAADGGCLVAFLCRHQGRRDVDLWLMEFDGRGSLKWLRIFRMPEMIIGQLRPSPAGGGFLVGFKKWGTWVAKFGPLGKLLWMRTIYEQEYMQNGGGLVATPDGGCLVSSGGRSSDRNTRIVKLDARGNQEWARRVTHSGTLNLSALAPLENGGFLAAGMIIEAGSVLSELLVAKLDRRGAVLWTRSYSSGGIYMSASAISENRDGTITVVGYRYHASGFWGMVLKIDWMGEPLLGRECDGNLSDFSSAVDTPEGGTLIAGVRNGGPWWLEPRFLRLDAAGTVPGCDVCQTITFSSSNVDTEVDPTSVILQRREEDEIVRPFSLEDAVSDPVIECRNDQVRLLSPAAGEALRSGAAYPLLWETSPTVQSVDIEFSPDNGASWEPLAAGLGGGSYPWSVPTTAPGSGRALIRVTGRGAAGELLDTDASDGSFRVEVVRVWGFAPGARIRGGKRYAIRWSVNGTERPVVRSKVQITTDGGASWRPLGSTGQTGAADLVMPATNRKLPRCRLRVRVLDAEGRVVGQGLSEGFFTLRP